MLVVFILHVQCIVAFPYWVSLLLGSGCNDHGLCSISQCARRDYVKGFIVNGRTIEGSLLVFMTPFCSHQCTY
jgi:hypothetical protein